MAEHEGHICNGVRVSGYWKGCACEGIAQYTGKDGKRYCVHHLGIANKTPERFEEAKIYKAKRLKKQEINKDK